MNIELKEDDNLTIEIESLNGNILYDLKIRKTPNKERFLEVVKL